MSDASSKMFNATCRVEQIIWIPGAVADVEALPDAFSETFVEYLPEATDAPLYEALPELACFVSTEVCPPPDEVAYSLRKRSGFLVQAATPVFRAFGKTGDGIFSWGHYHTAWLYAPDESSIAEVVIKWAKVRRAVDKKARAAA